MKRFHPIETCQFLRLEGAHPWLATYHSCTRVEWEGDPRGGRYRSSSFLDGRTTQRRLFLEGVLEKSAAKLLPVVRLMLVEVRYGRYTGIHDLYICCDQGWPHPTWLGLAAEGAPRLKESRSCLRPREIPRPSATVAEVPSCLQGGIEHHAGV